MEAAYLLPLHADPGNGVTTSGVEGRQSPADSEMLGILTLFHDAMLLPNPSHIHLTSCACLLRVWAHETAGPQGASASFLAWASQQAELINDICECLQAGLQVGPLEDPNWQCTSEA